MATYTTPDRGRTPVRGKAFLNALAFQSALARSGKYRADVDGLRAVAVLAVVFYHAKIFRCSGGYVGVDVFFVISGYLITSLIAKEIIDGKFSFLSFYERRVRRIFPALFGVLLISALIAVVLFIPGDLASFGKSLIATTLFVSNFHFWRAAQPLGYFSQAPTSETLLHTWSLSVEEQFYLVFPAALLLIFRWAGKRLNACLLFLAAASFCLNIWATYHKPVAAFYLFAPRAWELLIGSLLATQAMPPLGGRVTREVMGVLGLGLVVIAVLALSRTSPFPGFSALLPCLGAWLCIYAGGSGNSTTKALLSFRPSVFIGIISYSLYLWRWPLLTFSRYFAAGDLTGVQTALALLSSLIMAGFSFQFIERPFRGASSSITRRQIFTFGLTASLASLAVGSTAYLTHGLPRRYSEPTRSVSEYSAPAS